MKKLLSLLLLSLLTTLVAGCASTGLLKAYSGPEQPAAQIATVILPASVEVESINGTQQPNVTRALLKPVYSITLLPGAQDWRVRYYAPLADGYEERQREVTESPWTSIQFTAEASQTYHLHVETPRAIPGQHGAQDKVRFTVVAEKPAEPARPAPRAVPTKPAEPAPAVVVPSPAKAAAPQTLEFAAFEQLKSWWNVAGPRERQAFRDWLMTQSGK